ncbi:MAG: N-acetyl-gamma-glutamyl-phosphate reductase [Geminicoccaceae bacterium]
MGDRVAVGILGASGYTGAELVRLLARHPGVRVAALTAERQAGKPLGSVFPHLAAAGMPDLVKIDEVDFGKLDMVFCALPHATTQAVIKALPAAQKVVDLSADFRLRDPELYARTYGHAHQAVELQQEAVYGLTEHYRAQVKATRLVANPGCYTTTSELPLVPLVRDRLIDLDDIVIDAKSGVTGAGRDPKQGSLFSEVGENFSAYGVATHRHAPEIDQCLADFAGRPVTVTFTPHLVPMSRGIFATIYVRLAQGVAPRDLHARLEAAYAGEPFVRVVPFAEHIATQHVRGTNDCLIAVHPDRRPGRAILLAVTDNLVKGASGQAVQNMNVMLGFDERAGLAEVALFP